MYVKQLVGLAQTNLSHIDYLIVQCLVCATYLSPDTVNEMEPHILHYVKFFLRWVRYTPLYTPCNHIMAIIDYFNAAITFVSNAFLALCTALTNHCLVEHP